MTDTDKPYTRKPELGKVTALIKARGGGSTLAGKNMYPLNGMPVLGHALQTLKKAAFIDKVYVWSESKDIQALTRRLDAVPLDRPLSMVHYHSGFHSDQEFNFYSLNQMKTDINAPIEVIINFNCNYVLFRTSSLEKMFDKLMNDPTARSIIALAPVAPGLCLDNGRHGLFPFMNDANIQREDYPRIYRKLGISMLKCGLHYAALQKQIYLPVGHEEGIDLHDEEDTLILEYHLNKQKE